MGYQIEMLDVGNADAIILIYIDEYNHEYVVVIDAGNKSDGKKIVDKINKYTHQKYIDLAICSHPDNDHIGGFFYILDNMCIKEFWIHDPGKHVNLSEVQNALSRESPSRPMDLIRESINNNISIIKLIDSKEIVRKEPFNGLKYRQTHLTVLGPTKELYENLLQTFRTVSGLYSEELFLENYKLLQNINESSTVDLDKDDDMSSVNNSSTIIAFHPPNNEKYLFTGDAGPKALKDVIKNNYDWTKKLSWLDVPHHGSIKNLTTSIINHFEPNVAFVSGKGQGKYPSPAVVNALKKVGSKVYTTAISGDLLHYYDMQKRENYNMIREQD